LKRIKERGKGRSRIAFRLGSTLAGASLLAASLLGTGTHVAMAATDTYQVVFQANTKTLYGYASNGTQTSTTLGLEAGTSPSTSYLSDATELSAFQANTNTLYLYKWNSKTQISTTLGMDPGTSPALIGLPTGGGWVSAFQSNAHDLYIYDSAGDKVNTGLGMMPGTSPAIAARPNGAWVVAFQANNGALHTYGSGGGNSATSEGMDAKSSPSIIALANGSYEIAFETNADDLAFFHTGGSTLHTTLGMDAHTSPSIAAASDGSFVAAFQSNDHFAGTYNSNGHSAVTSEGMMAGTSPALLPVPGGFELAFQANTGHLSIYHTGGTANNTTLGMDAGTSPSLAIGPPVAPRAGSGGSTVGESAANIAVSQIGYTDDPYNSYCNAYTFYWNAGSTTDRNGITCQGDTRAELWCADFAAWVWKKAGVPVTYGSGSGDLSGAVSTFYNYGTAHGTWHPVSSGYPPEPGDAAVYATVDHKTGAVISWDHVAIVTGGTNAAPNVVNGDWGNPPAGEDGVIGQDDETTNGAAGDSLLGYTSPVS
jgi:CHAP domain